MNPHSTAGFTWIELLAVIVVLAVLAALIFPSTGRGGLVSGQRTQTLSNMKQLHLATQAMVLDGETTGNKTLGWPGDTGGSFLYWEKQLIPVYLSTNDFCKLLSAPGKIVRSGEVRSMNEGAILVYAVSTNSPSETVFLTTANFTNTPTGGRPLDKSALPYGNKGFVVFRKGGDGAILLPKQTGQTNIIGSFVPLCQ